MQTVFKRIALVAPARASVLVVGEPGTETEAVARAIHDHSACNHGPFVTFHAADRSPDDVEAALFGNVAESYRGDGLLVGAAGGTLFLGEVTDLPLAAQSRLLGVLDRHEVVPVGGCIPRRVDVRLIAATVDPTAAVRSGRLRPNLASRLGVYPIALPPLRDRIEDVPALAEAALRSFGVANPAERLTPEALAALQTRPWPGNVRELRAVVGHAATEARAAPLRSGHFPTTATVAGGVAERLCSLVVEWVRERTADRGTEPSDLYRELREVVEPALLGEILRPLGGRLAPAARWLGLTRTTTRKLIRTHLLLAGGDPSE